jgi:hypothetical protein
LVPAPQKVLELVKLFEQNAAEYRAGHYNEAMLRQEFVNPLFKCLGWDMDNTQGHAEAYKDVIHEAAIKIGGATKAPDYCFRIGGTPKFFLEAKKLAVNIKDDPHTAFLLRRYAWSVKLPLSVLPEPEKSAHDKMVDLVDQMLSLRRHLRATKTAHARLVLERQIDAADSKIDKLVYELYGLTEEEIAIVEEGSPK